VSHFIIPSQIQTVRLPATSDLVSRHSNCLAVELDANFFFNVVGEAHVYVNDRSVRLNVSDYNRRAGYHQIIPIGLTLNPGDDNSLRIGAAGSSGKSYVVYFLISQDLKLTYVCV
jgi:hypothetical protein